MLRPARIRRDKREIDLVLLSRGKSNLRLLRFLFDALDRVRLFRQVNAAIFLKLVNYPIHDARVPIVTAEVSIAIGRFYFENAVTNFQNRNIEGATAKVIDSDLLVLLLIQPVSE